YDAENNHSTRTTAVASTQPCPDTQAPTAPTNLVQSGRTPTSISFSWSASTDNAGVAGYGLYRNATLLTTTTATTYTFAGLSCGTSYTLAVDAYDAGANRSAQTSITLSTT